MTEPVLRSKEQTNWAVLGAGEGGNKIACMFLDRKHASIGNRITLINTAQADMENAVRETVKRIGTSGTVVPQITIGRHMFGDNTGAGNDPFEGERFATQYYDTAIVRALRSAGIDKADAMLSLCALGGGTGNGSVPYIIKATRERGGAGLQNMRHFVFAAWPHESEAKQKHANAVAGLSRLLMLEESGKRNADFVMLCDNNRLAEIVVQEGNKPDWPDINRVIRDALDLFTIGGQDAEGVMDVKNFIQGGQKQVGLHHFTCGVALDNDPEVVTLEKAFDFALRRAFMAVNLQTVTMAYVLVRAPAHLKGSDDFTYKAIADTFERWHTKRMNLRVGMHSFITSPTKKDGFDVLVVLGGFDLRPLMQQHRHKLQEQIAMAENIPDEPHRAKRLKKIDQNLESYLARMTKLHEMVGVKS